MTIRSLSPPSRAAARRVKNATSDAAFRVPLGIDDDFIRKVLHVYWWYFWLADEAYNEIVAEAAGNSSHWWNNASNAEQTRYVYDESLRRARTQVPF